MLCMHFWGFLLLYLEEFQTKRRYVVIIPALIFYSIAMFLMSGNLITDLQINLGLLVGLGLAGSRDNFNSNGF